MVGLVLAAGCAEGLDTDDAFESVGVESATYGALGDLRCGTSVSRVAGRTRYGTAAGVARRLFPDGTRTAIVAGGASVNPDALVAGPLAATLGAPVLLATPSRLPEETRDALLALGVGKVFVLGGADVLSVDVVRQIERLGIDVQRIAGDTRYDTAAAVARLMGESDLVIVASGEKMVDALPGAAAGAALRAPLLYVSHDSVPTATKRALADIGAKRVVMLGGESVVSTSVYRWFRDRYSTKRLAGADRYQTAAMVAHYTFDATDSGRAPVFVANGENPIDALAASSDGSPVLLTPKTGLTRATRDFLARRARCATILGGMNAIAEVTEGQIRTALVSILVKNRTQLLRELDRASDGQTIYIADEAKIDLSDNEAIEIPAGVTLMSGRGVAGSAGALIYKDRGNATGLFYPKARARIRGIRLKGPDTSAQCRDCAPRHLGVEVREHGVRIDGCEIWGWARGIEFRNARHGHVIRNHIHHNRREGLGYGVVLMHHSDAIIERNHFHDNRHSVAGSGERDQSYVARYNLVNGGATGSVFDMHGEWENPLEGNENSKFAGRMIHIHHNIVIVPSDVPAVGIRGLPRKQALIEHNCFSHPSVENVVWQQHPDGNMLFETRPPYVANVTVRNNRFAHAGGSCDER